MNNTSKVIIGVLVIALIGVVVYFTYGKTEAPITATSTPVTAQTPTQTNPNTIVYKNTDYGFTFDLPKSWDDYTIVEDEWEGDSINASGQVQLATVHGPLVSIRHPDWDYKSPRQDIPIMVFTIQQWNDMQADKFHIGAAPIGPSELARSKKYVFAIPARYNFSYLTGYEEVDELVRGSHLKAF